MSRVKTAQGDGSIVTFLRSQTQQNYPPRYFSYDK